MQTERRDVLWLNGSETISITELAGVAGLSEADVRELVDSGVIMPMNPADLSWTFSADCAVTVRKASRLRHDLELDSHALALALALLEQIRALESELSQMRAQQAADSRA
ncbi:MAG: chaperone modulator CbpM [Betaproteobacteria bacterium]